MTNSGQFFLLTVIVIRVDAPSGIGTNQQSGTRFSCGGFTLPGFLAGPRSAADHRLTHASHDLSLLLAHVQSARTAKFHHGEGYI